MPRVPIVPLADRLQARPFAVDATVVAVVVLFVLATRAYSTSTDVLLDLGLVVPLAWRRRAPVPAAVAVTAACLAELALDGGFLRLNVAALVAVHALAAYSGRRAGRVGLALGLVGAVLGGNQVTSAANAPREFLIATGLMAVSVAAAWVVGDLHRVRGEQAQGLLERARMLEVEREQELRLAAGDERARIAREMHDVVAHSLSVVVAQSDGGRYAGRTDPAAALAALVAIGETGRTALGDMRTLLGVLRQGHDATLSPQPDVAAVSDLVHDVQATGLQVDLVVEGAEHPLAAGPQLAAYRIVQESLTNVLKHAGPAARAQVCLQWGTDALAVSVLDTGRGTAVVDEAGGGQGVRGMRERVRLHGGALEVGPHADGGFRVHGVLPYPALP